MSYEVKKSDWGLAEGESSICFLLYDFLFD